jgi:hypothetical protein
MEAKTITNNIGKVIKDFAKSDWQGLIKNTMGQNTRYPKITKTTFRRSDSNFLMLNINHDPSGNSSIMFMPIEYSKYENLIPESNVLTKNHTFNI